MNTTTTTPTTKEAAMVCNPSPIVAVGPSGPGAIGGFESRCSCGFVIRSSLETIIRRDVWEHVEYMARKGQKGA